MSAKMNRFQTLPDSDKYKMPFPGGFSRTRKDPIIAEAINYIGLSFDDDEFIYMLNDTEIRIDYRPIQEDKDTEVRVSIEVVTDSENANFSVLLNTYDRQITIKFDCPWYPSYGLPVIKRGYDTYPFNTYPFSQILSVRAFLYSDSSQFCTKEFINPVLIDTQCVLSVLKDDLAEGIEKYLRYYITNYAEHYISEILDICAMNEWYDMTAAILRICYEEGIQIPSVEISL